MIFISSLKKAFFLSMVVIQSEYQSGYHLQTVSSGG